MSSLYDDLMNLIVYYSFFLMVFGFIANLLALVVCLRKNMRSIPTFVFYAFALFSNTLSLYWWNLDHYYVHYHNTLLEDLSLELCRTITFFQMYSFQTGAWFLVNVVFYVENYWWCVFMIWIKGPRDLDDNKS
jgi:hypothetical protein